MNTRKFECPFCDYPVELPEEHARGEIHCPSCSRFFDPATFAEPGIKAPQTKAKTEELTARFEERDRKEEREAIRQQAGIFSFIAILVGVGGLIFLLCGLRAGIAMEPFASDLIIGTCLLGVAIWLYLIAQVIHIRANTHR